MLKKLFDEFDRTPHPEVRNLAISLHHNQKYDDKPFIYHLDYCNFVMKRFEFYIPINKIRDVQLAIYLHDVIEDYRPGINGKEFVEIIANKTVSDIVWAVTDERGKHPDIEYKNRAARQNDDYFNLIRRTEYATFVKLCDRISNVEYSIYFGNKFDMYKNEHDNFYQKLYTDEFAMMFDHLNKIMEYKLSQ